MTVNITDPIFSDKDKARAYFMEAYCLYPSYATFRQKSLDNVPAYCYTTKEISYFIDCFYRLKDPVRQLTEAIRERQLKA